MKWQQTQHGMKGKKILLNTMFASIPYVGHSKIEIEIK